MKKRDWILLLLTVIGGTSVVHAEGEIVYAARYYAPQSAKTKPGATTYWHLYRVNPDGTGRRQITTGTSDDDSPAWSPDGRWIAFLRYTGAKGSRDEPGFEEATPTLCIVAANGGPVRIVRRWPVGRDVALPFGPGGPWSADGKTLAVWNGGEEGESPPSVELLNAQTGALVRRVEGLNGWRWAPDGKRALLETGYGNRGTRLPDRLYNVAAGKEITLPADLTALSWRSATSLVGVSETGTPHALVFLNADGKEVRRARLARPIPNTFDEKQEAAPTATGLYPPNPSAFVLYGTNNGDSTAGHYNTYYRVAADGSSATKFTDGKVLAWSADGRRFCTVVSRDLMPYGGKRPDGTQRSVWTQPLLVGDGKTGAVRPVVKGPVYVLSASWRPTP